MAGTIKIKTDLMAPSATKVLEFSGQNPTRVFKLVPDAIMEAIEIDTGTLWEDEIRWDASGEPVAFYGYWRGRKKKDQYSTLWLEIEVNGEKYKDNTGKVKIKIKGKLKTKFSYGNIFKRAMIEVYRYVFYREHKLKYIDEANKNIDKFESIIREEFEMMRKP